MRNLRQSTVCALLLTVALAPATPATAQLPDTFSNLRVLPEDIAKDQLVETMRGFSFALAVRCSHCHVGEEGKPLSEFDFAADDKDAKKTARGMMRMMQKINGELLPAATQGEGPPLAVTCVTCHRGQPRPRPIQDVLAEVVASDGIEAAVARYHALRERYYGGFTFDFSPGMLPRLAEHLAADQPDAAFTFLELNAGLYPESLQTQLMLGDLHLRRGEKDAARARYQKALELAPENRFVQRKLAAVDEAE